MARLGVGIVLAVLVGAALPAGAEDGCRGPDGLDGPATELPMVPNQFHRSATGGVGCVLRPEDGAKGPRLLPCLRIGPVGVGDRVEAVEQVLGAPDSISPLSETAEVRVYFIRQRTQPQPYFVVTYLKGAAVAVQLLGPPADMPQTLSSLALGDPQQRVVDVLGLPGRRCTDSRRGLDTWYYPPFPIAVDVADGAVVGLKATIPVVGR